LCGIEVSSSSSRKRHPRRARRVRKSQLFKSQLRKSQLFKSCRGASAPTPWPLRSRACRSCLPLTQLYMHGLQYLHIYVWSPVYVYTYMYTFTHVYYNKAFTVCWICTSPPPIPDPVLVQIGGAGGCERAFDTLLRCRLRSLGTGGVVPRPP